MTVSQTGRFRNGTYGFDVEIKLSDRENISLAAATVISLQMFKPDKTLLFTRNLGLGAILNSTIGIIKWTIQDGDMPVAGTYTATLTITFEPGRVLIVDGRFSVE